MRRATRQKPFVSALPHLRINPRTGMHEARDSRVTLHESALGTVEDVAVERAKPVPPGFTSKTCLAVTYLGAAYWKVGRREAFVDSNRTLMLRAGEAFTDRQMGQQVGRASVVFTPAQNVLAEITAGVPLTAITRPTSLGTQQIAHMMLALGNEASHNPLLGDELMIGALLAALDPETGYEPRPEPRMIGRVKEILHAETAETFGLCRIADAVGYSAVHVRKAFRKTEGVTLSYYQMRLRLNRALIELRTCDDITGLALNLGFSSHSHFATAFRSMFRLTPSQYRLSVRAGGIPPAGWDNLN